MENNNENNEENKLKGWFDEKKQDYANKAEDHLNSLPIDKRKKIFKMVFGFLGLIVLIRIILFIAFNLSSSSEKESVSKSDSIQKVDNVTESDVLNMDLSTHEKPVDVSTKKGLDKMIQDIRKEDSIKYERNK